MGIVNFVKNIGRSKTPTSTTPNIILQITRQSIQEADIVLHLDGDHYALIECKLGSRDIEEGAKHILEIKRLIR